MIENYKFDILDDEYNFIGTITDLNTVRSNVPVSVARFDGYNEKNRPSDVGNHGGIVFALNNWNSQGIQICYLNNVPDNLYLRFLSANQWSIWYKFNIVPVT